MLCELCADCVACAEYRALLQHQTQPAITEGAISASVPAVGHSQPYHCATSIDQEEEGHL